MNYEKFVDKLRGYEIQSRRCDPSKKAFWKEKIKTLIEEGTWPECIHADLS